MDKFLKIFNKLDWAMGGGTVVVGMYLQNWWLVAGGGVGLLAAWYKPAERIKRKLESKFLRKKTVTSDAQKVQAEDEFYAQMGVAEAPLSTAEPVSETVSYTRSMRSGPVHLSISRHNVLKPEHFNLETTQGGPRPWA